MERNCTFVENLDDVSRNPSDLMHTYNFMNLIIDQGNSRAKLALFRGTELYKQVTTNEVNTSAIKLFIAQERISGVMLSTVKKIPAVTLNHLQSLAERFVLLSHTTRLPFSLNYRTPETLGMDRIAAVAGAYFAQPKRNILVIDAGTAITYDFIDSSAVYRGGNIAPGLEMRLQALHQKTDKLPQVDKNGTVVLLGSDTETAIRSGVVQGIVFEIEGYIKHLSEECPDLLIFLTGGDTFYFDKRLKNIIFADEYLVLKGLNGILQYNAK
ncbi:MAG: type III pantothenate kinase [Bacteroidales bacterium]